MNTITIKSENGYTNFLLTHEGVHERLTTEVCKDAAALRESLGKLLEKIQNDVLTSRLVRNLYAMQHPNAHPSVHEFAKNALANLGYPSPAQ